MQDKARAECQKLQCVLERLNSLPVRFTAEWDDDYGAICLTENATIRYLLVPVESGWEVVALRHYAGFFNPRDGGNPPETTETSLGVYHLLTEAAAVAYATEVCRWNNWRRNNAGQDETVERLHHAGQRRRW